MTDTVKYIQHDFVLYLKEDILYVAFHWTIFLAWNSTNIMNIPLRKHDPQH